MDILIKNMEMPSACGECKLVQRYRYSDECQYLHKKIARNGRLNGCPLVEVPPHGRLIDATELEASDAIIVGEDAWNMVHNAPTVLEASNG